MGSPAKRKAAKLMKTNTKDRAARANPSRSTTGEAATGAHAVAVRAGAATRNQRLRPVERSSVTLVRFAMVAS
jgi:hypothetical protein